MASREAVKLDTPSSEARAESDSPSVLGRLSRWLSTPSPTAEAGEGAGLSALEVRRLHRQLRHCFEASLTDLESNVLAKNLMHRYLGANADGRRVILRAMALEAVRYSTVGLDFSEMLESARVRFFKRFNALPDGLQFLVALRADMLANRRAIDGLAELEGDLGSLLSAWFDVGFLDLQRITWDSPASLLEKLMRYEAVHQIASWNDLRNRLDSDRRCYAFFHPRLPKEPLIFVEVAFLKELAGDVQALLNEEAPLEDMTRVRWAIFYSISNTQVGLRGVSFGNFLLKRVIEAIKDDLPQLERFATLSPMPGFVEWLRARKESDVAELLGPRLSRLLKAMQGGPLSFAGEDLLVWLEHPGHAELEDAKRDLGERLGAYYLARAFSPGGLPLDAVARFHLGNGARIERINWRADGSPKGRAESLGMMVNYQYQLDELDDNLLRLRAREPRLSRAVSRLVQK